MDEKVRAALSNGGIIDITTTGRKSGEARRIEIVFHNIDGHLYISGFPREKKRSWLANLEVHPNFTFHLKTSGSFVPEGTTLPDVAAAWPPWPRPTPVPAEGRKAWGKVR